MGSLSRTVRQRTCWSSSASSLQPWLPPQLYPYYGSYGMYGYPSYGYPMVQSPMVSAYPLAGYPSVGQRIAPYPMAGTRNLITLGNFLQLNGVFEQVATATTTVPATTVKGNFNIQQNGI